VLQTHMASPRSLNTVDGRSGKGDARPRLLVIGPTYVIGYNRQKLRALCAYFDVTCATSEPSDAKIFDRTITELENLRMPEELRIERFSEWPPKTKLTQVYYRGLHCLFSSRRFDLVLVEAEPWAVIKWQSWVLTRLLQKHCLFGEFTWENVLRPGLKGKLLAGVYRASSLAVDFAICGNRAAGRIFQRYGLREDQVLVAPQLGIDPGQYRPVTGPEKARLRQRLGVTPDTFVIGFAGRFVPEKGVLDLVQAFLQLAPGHPELVLAMVGDGPLRTELSAVRHPRFRLLSPLRNEQIAGFMQMLDLFVLPSRPWTQGSVVWEEQFGRVLIEAMACGVPTLGADSGAIPEVLGSPEFIFPHSRPESLADRIAWLAGDAKLRVQVGIAQRQRVLEHYTNEAVAKRYAEFLLPRLTVRRSRD
jgi:glycosyltransferase involved in cell wall biosynthesis